MATRKWLLAMLTGLGVAASAGMALPVQAADSTLTQVHPGEPAQVDEPRPVRPR